MGDPRYVPYLHALLLLLLLQSSQEALKERQQPLEDALQDAVALDDGSVLIID